MKETLEDLVEDRKIKKHRGCSAQDVCERHAQRREEMEYHPILKVVAFAITVAIRAGLDLNFFALY